MVVLYDFIVDEYTPAAAIVTFSFDLFCTYPPNCAARPETASEMLTLLIVGTTEEGTVTLNVLDTAEPIFVLPEYVVTVTFAVPDVALGITLIQSLGIA